MKNLNILFTREIMKILIDIIIHKVRLDLVNLEIH